LGAEICDSAELPNSAVCNWRAAAIGCSRTANFSLMLVQMSGARPIHSLIGPAIAVTAKLSAPTASTTIRMAVIQGEMPRRRAAFTSGASVSATTPAANTGSRMTRPR
jgi:hypothetical protein